MDTREKLQTLLSEYVVDTLNLIQTVRDFCDREEKWTLQRKTELESMKHIKEQADKISLKFGHVKNSKNKGKAFGEFLKSGLTQVTADSRRQKLEKKLGDVLKNTFEGLEKLDHFLDAVEKLTVTSLNVFTDQSVLPNGENPANVRSVITAAKMASPLLINFKRNNETFFLPILNNVDVMVFQLDKYIQITQQLCEKLNKKWMQDEPLKFSSSVKNSKKKMLNNLNQLRQIRNDQDTRLMFLFREHALNFIGLYSQRCSEVKQFLSDLEENAVQLDRMKKGASISTVTGSSVGIAGSVLSIVGIALAPVTAGVSLALTVTGLSLGVTSGVNSLVTGITETAVNAYHGKKVQSIFQTYVNDTKRIQCCLQKASSEHVERLYFISMFGARKAEKGKTVSSVQVHKVKKVQKQQDTSKVKELVGKALRHGMFAGRLGGVAKGIESLVDAAKAAKALQSEGVVTKAVGMGLQEARSTRSIPNLAADLPDIGQLAKGTPLALSKTARAGFITANALFIGLDVLFICKDSISLAKGSKSETSQLIRSRATLWKSELEAWQKIYDSLCIGIEKFRNSQILLEQPFLPQ
ncbi:uncharacterized protein [Misgurnus anguillicaudatus]|uniref:uncharacterized protein n=1 Tax=Misgurnus anguillicaudatus TaxID=75329 RepID=UPI003CCF8EC1